MSGFGIALRVESRKFARATAPRVATASLIGGLAALCAGFLAAPADSQFAAKLASLDLASGWAGLFSLAAQIASVAGLLVAGVVLAWLMAREFVDAAAQGLFALPVSRAALAAAKLVVFAAWAVVTAIGASVAVLAVGGALGLGAPDGAVLDGAVLEGMARLALAIVLMCALATPAAWIATLSRGYLAPIGAIVAIVAGTQVVVALGAGAWFPWAAPALWAGFNGSEAASAVSPWQLALAAPASALFAALTLSAWRRLSLER